MHLLCCKLLHIILKSIEERKLKIALCIYRFIRMDVYIGKHIQYALWTYCIYSYDDDKPDQLMPLTLDIWLFNITYLFVHQRSIIKTEKKMYNGTKERIDKNVLFYWLWYYFDYGLNCMKPRKTANKKLCVKFMTWQCHKRIRLHTEPKKIINENDCV